MSIGNSNLFDQALRDLQKYREKYFEAFYEKYSTIEDTVEYDIKTLKCVVGEGKKTSFPNERLFGCSSYYSSRGVKKFKKVCSLAAKTRYEKKHGGKKSKKICSLAEVLYRNRRDTDLLSEDEDENKSSLSDEEYLTVSSDEESLSDPGEKQTSSDEESLSDSGEKEKSPGKKSLSDPGEKEKSPGKKSLSDPGEKDTSSDEESLFDPVEKEASDENSLSDPGEKDTSSDEESLSDPGEKEKSSDKKSLSDLKEKEASSDEKSLSDPGDKETSSKEKITLGVPKEKELVSSNEKSILDNHIEIQTVSSDVKSIFNGYKEKQTVPFSEKCQYNFSKRKRSDSLYFPEETYHCNLKKAASSMNFNFVPFSSSKRKNNLAFTPLCYSPSSMYTAIQPLPCSSAPKHKKCDPRILKSTSLNSNSNDKKFIGNKINSLPHLPSSNRPKINELLSCKKKEDSNNSICKKQYDDSDICEKFSEINMNSKLVHKEECQRSSYKKIKLDVSSAQIKSRPYLSVSK